MREKIFLIPLIGVLLFATAGQCFADASAQLKQADKHRKNGQYEQAEQIYHQIITDYPGTDDALKAQNRLVILYILMERQADAQVALDRLMADFAGHPDLPGDLYGIATQHRKAGNSDQAETVHELIAQRWPNSVYAKTPLHIPKAKILSSIRTKQYRKAQIAIEQLIADYSGHAYLPGTLFEIARRHKQAQKYTAAESIYRQIVDQYPDHWRARKARFRLANIEILSLVDSGDADAAQPAIDKLIADFAEESELPSLVYELAAKFEAKEQYLQARDIYQQITQQWPQSAHANKARLDIPRMEILSHIHSGDDAAAQTAIERLLADLPDDQQRAKTANWIGYQYRQRQKYESASQLYQYVVDKWPLSDEGLTAQRNIVLCRIDLGDDVGVQAGMQRLFTDLAGHDEKWEAVSKIAYRYRKLENHEQAIEVYQNFLQKWPDDDYAIHAQRGLVLCKIALGDDAGAQAATEELLTNFSWHRDIVKTVDRISKEYRRLEHYEKANQLYQYVLDTWPDPASGLWAQTQWAVSHIRAANIEDADQAVVKLLSDYSDSSEIGKCLNQIAKCYLRAGQYNTALELSNYVIANCPVWQRQVAMWAHEGAAVSHIGLGNDIEVQTAVDKLTADFSDHPGLSAAIFRIAEQYFYKAEHLRAIELWELILIEYAQSPAKDKIPFLLAHCYEAIDEWQRAVEYYRQVVEEYPNSRYAHRAPHRIGLLYRFAGECEEALYWFQQQRELYSDHLQAQRALFEQGTVYRLDLKDYEKAAKVFEQYITEYPDDEHTCVSYYGLAKCYESIGNKAQAIAVLQEALTRFSQPGWPEIIKEGLQRLQEAGDE